MEDHQIKIHYRFLFNLNYGVVSRYNKFFVSAETYNDLMGLTYDKMLSIANEENININFDNVQLEYFYFNNKHDFQKHVPKKKYDNKIHKDHSIFHISLIYEDQFKLHKIKKTY